MNPASIHTPVLIIGGSLVGLSASLFLAWRGVPHILVEKHHGSAAHPRATGFTEHTLEFFRAAGIAERIPQVPPGATVRRARVESLAGQHFEELPWTPGQPEERDGKASPMAGAAIAQDLLEPILREAARARGADLRTGVELLSVQQDAQRVTAQLRQRDTGACYAITADYLIAADGAASPIREQLGIARQGAGPLRVLRSVLFRCAEADAFLEQGIRQFDIDQPGFKGFLGTYSDGRWFLMFEEQSESTDAQLRALVRQAVGKDMAFELITTGRWELAGLIADRFSEGRIFLAGDAAHQLPPTRGGYGANTGIDDAYNLAWKLQRVVRQQSRPALLDTYTDERRPIAWLRHQQTFARPDYAKWVGDGFKEEPLYGNLAMELGQLTRSSAILGADAALPPAAHPRDWAGQPGTRAPHVWVRHRGNSISSIDLLTEDFVLLTADPRWSVAAAHLSLKTLLAGADMVFPADQAFGDTFGTGDDGAVIVRPDGIIAWRSAPAAIPDAMLLRAVMKKIAMPHG